jgi:hypothetical protein
MTSSTTIQNPFVQIFNMPPVPPHRRGHAGVRAILDDIFTVLPPEYGKPEYKRCRTTFGLLQSFFNKAETSEDPKKEYVEVQKMELALRQRLLALPSTKGVPPKMIQCLDELKVAIAEVIQMGWSIKDDEVLKMEEMQLGKEEVSPKVNIKIKDQLQKYKSALAEEKTKNRLLNEEINRVAMRLRAVEAERDRLLGVSKPGQRRI